MAHDHQVIDEDKNHFIIDPINRSITNTTPKSILIKNDHNSERFTFEIPRYIEGHDMTKSNKVEIHYINIGKGGRERYNGIYEVKDFGIDPENPNTCVLTWLISNNATKTSGTLNFAIRFACLTDDVVDYSWSTTICTGINVLDSVYNADMIMDQEVIDILQNWWNEIERMVDAKKPVEFTDAVSGEPIIEDDITTTPVTINKTDGSSVNFNVQAQNGKDGVDGADGAGIISCEVVDGDLIIYSSENKVDYFITEDGQLAFNLED